MDGPRMLALFLTESAVGSLLILLLVPPREAGRRFFQLTVAQSCVLITLGLALALTGGQPSPSRVALLAAAAVLTMLSAGLFHLGRLRGGQALMAAAILPGLAAVVTDALALIPSGDSSLYSKVHYPVDAVTSGLAIGSVLIAMILGHYYLNVPGLSIRHLQRLTVIFMAAVGLRLAVVGVAIARESGRLQPLLSLLLDTEGRPLPQGGLDPYVLVFLLVHLLFGGLAPVIMSVMAWRTALLSSTQSATGILYVALVMVIMGEMVSRYILTLTGLPL